MKKRTLFTYLIITWFILIIIVNIITIIYSKYTHKRLYSEAVQEIREHRLFLPEDISYMSEAEALNTLARINTIVVYDLETNELVFPSEDTIPVTIYHHTPVTIKGETTPYTYIDNAPPEYYFYPASFLEDYPTGTILDYYIKDSTLLPGHVEYWTSKNGTEIVDLTPEDTTGYTHVTQEIQDIHFQNNRIPDYINEDEFKWIKKHWLSSGLVQNEQHVLPYEYDPMISEYRIYTGIEFSMNGKKYFAFTYDEINISYLHYYITTDFYSNLVQLSFFVALILSLILYKRYETLRYQKMLTMSMAHDLKSPLTVLSGYAENLLDNTNPEKQDVYLRQIQSNVGYMNETIDNVLQLSRLQNEKTKLKRIKEPVLPVFQELLEKHKTELEQKHLTVNCSGDATIKYDRIALTRALDNLINNAIKYTPDNGEITISISQKSIVISNPYTHEITCSPKQLKDPFQKGSNSRGEQSGTGIGLHIANILLKKQKFSLSLQTKEQTFVATINLTILT